MQALLSEQAVPSAATGLEQVPVLGLHVPIAWQASWATHTTGVPGMHAPEPLQVSAPLQALPSEQEVPAPAFGFEQAPLDGLHVPAT